MKAEYSNYLELNICIEDSFNGEYLILPSGITTTLFLEDMVSKWKRFKEVITITPHTELEDLNLTKSYAHCLFLMIDASRIPKKVFEHVFKDLCLKQGAIMLTQVSDTTYASLLSKVHQDQMNKDLSLFNYQPKIKDPKRECSCPSLELFRFGCRSTVKGK